jgi:hypothetical protein
VLYGGPRLAPATGYTWTVVTWTSNSDNSDAPPCQSELSEPAVFSTALTDGWAEGASWIWSDQKNSAYAYLRKTITVPVADVDTDTVVSAYAFATARTDDYIMCGYKLYLNGEIIGVGPGESLCSMQRFGLHVHF